MNPRHLEQIINTSDSRALKKVLLDLCQLSPALSGAVVRGLAVHSTYAAGMMHQYRRSQQASRITPTRENNKEQSYDRVKDRLASHSKGIPVTPRLPKHTRQDIYSSSATAAHNRDTLTSLPVSAPSFRMKREYSPDSSNSDTVQDDLHHPGDFARRAHRKHASHTPF